MSSLCSAVLVQCRRGANLFGKLSSFVRHETIEHIVTQGSGNILLRRVKEMNMTDELIIVGSGMAWSDLPASLPTTTYQRTRTVIDATAAH